MLLISRPVSASHNLSMVSRLSRSSEVKNCYYRICVKTNLCRRMSSNNYWIKLYRNLQIGKQSSLRKQNGIFVAGSGAGQSLSRRRCSSWNVPSDEERGENGCFRRIQTILLIFSLKEQVAMRLRGIKPHKAIIAYFPSTSSYSLSLWPKVEYIFIS